MGDISVWASDRRSVSGWEGKEARIRSHLSVLAHALIGDADFMVLIRDFDQSVLVRFASNEAADAAGGVETSSCRNLAIQRKLRGRRSLEIYIEQDFELPDEATSPGSLDVFAESARLLCEDLFINDDLTAAVQLLDRLSFSYFVVDAEGRPVIGTPPAGLLSPSLSITGKGVVTKRGALSIEALLQEARTYFGQTGFASGQVPVFLKSRGGTDPCDDSVCYVVPLGSAISDPANAKHYAILAPRATGKACLKGIEALFSLTRSEASVVRLTMEGLDIDQICEELHLSKSTVRTYLKRCYCKAGVSGRAQLIARLGNMLVPLNSQSPDPGAAAVAAE